VPDAPATPDARPPLADPPPYTGAVLAGGASRRFGSDKCLHVYRGTTLLQHALAGLAGAERRLVVGRDATESPGARWIPDARPGLGPVGGLHAALAAAEHAWVALVGCDMPFVTPDLWRALFAYADDDVRVVMPEGPSGLEPLAALYRRDLHADLEARLEGGRVPLRWLRKEPGGVVVPWRHLAPHVPATTFLNANRPEDLP
jgi:molybdopterin-guanine dinucleotide biosynthesis protein A